MLFVNKLPMFTLTHSRRRHNRLQLQLQLSLPVTSWLVNRYSHSRSFKPLQSVPETEQRAERGTPGGRTEGWLDTCEGLGSGLVSYGLVWLFGLLV